MKPLTYYSICRVLLQNSVETIGHVIPSLTANLDPARMLGQKIFTKQSLSC